MIWSKRQIFVPSGLAYGEEGAGGKVGPNAALIFEIELLSIESCYRAGSDEQHVTRTGAPQVDEAPIIGITPFPAWLTKL